MEEELYDIGAVCKTLGTTSRTLRYYEEKGLISSTVMPPSKRRRYTDAQLGQIRNVLALRAIGLSVADLSALQKEGTDLKSAIELRIAHIHAAIDKKNRELGLLGDALTVIENGGDVCGTVQYGPDQITVGGAKDELRIRISGECTRAIVEDSLEPMFSHMSARLKACLPETAFRAARAEALQPLGNFVEYECTFKDPRQAHTVLSFVKYEKLGLKIRYVFRGEELHGLWLNYYEPKG